MDLTKKQLEDLTTGKAIFVEDMKRKDGETFSSFVKLEKNNILSFTRYNPDSPEGAREIYIPKEIGGVRLKPEDKDDLRAGKPVFLNDMVNRKGEEFSSFVKIDTETGKISYSRTQDGFDERPAFKVPQEYWGHNFTTNERSQLQDGKAIHVTGMTGFNGKEFSSWLKVNERIGRIDAYPENPDKPRQSAGQSANAARQESNLKPEKESQKQEEKANKKPANRRKVS